jgi:hypothetical protein
MSDLVEIGFRLWRSAIRKRDIEGNDREIAIVPHTTTPLNISFFSRPISQLITHRRGEN